MKECEFSNSIEEYLKQSRPYFLEISKVLSQAPIKVILGQISPVLTESQSKYLDYLKEVIKIIHTSCFKSEYENT